MFDQWTSYSKWVPFTEELKEQTLAMYATPTQYTSFLYLAASLRLYIKLSFHEYNDVGFTPSLIKPDLLGIYMVPKN